MKRQSGADDDVDDKGGDDEDDGGGGRGKRLASASTTTTTTTTTITTSAATSVTAAATTAAATTAAATTTTTSMAPKKINLDGHERHQAVTSQSRAGRQRRRVTTTNQRLAEVGLGATDSTQARRLAERARLETAHKATVAVVGGGDGGGGGGNDDDDDDDGGGQWQLPAERARQVARLRDLVVHDPIDTSSPDPFVQMAQRVGISLASVVSVLIRVAGNDRERRQQNELKNEFSSTTFQLVSEYNSSKLNPIGDDLNVVGIESHKPSAEQRRLREYFEPNETLPTRSVWSAKKLTLADGSALVVGRDRSAVGNIGRVASAVLRGEPIHERYLSVGARALRADMLAAAAANTNNNNNVELPPLPADLKDHNAPTPAMRLVLLNYLKQNKQATAFFLHNAIGAIYFSRVHQLTLGLNN